MTNVRSVSWKSRLGVVDAKVFQFYYPAAVRADREEVHAIQWRVVFSLFSFSILSTPPASETANRQRAQA